MISFFLGFQYLPQVSHCQQQQQLQANLQNHAGLIHPHLMPTTTTTTSSTIPESSDGEGGGHNIIYLPSSISTPNSPSLKIVPRRIGGGGGGGVSASANATPQLARKQGCGGGIIFENDVKTNAEEKNPGPGSPLNLKRGGNFDSTQLQVRIDKSEFAKVSEDMNELVYHLNSIQHDISELAGRPISICDNNQEY